jgi:hypothetical protein
MYPWRDIADLTALIQRLTSESSFDRNHAVVVADFPFVRRHEGRLRSAERNLALRSILDRAGLSADLAVLRLPDVVALEWARRRHLSSDVGLAAITFTSDSTSAAILCDGKPTQVIRGDFGSIYPGPLDDSPEISLHESLRSFYLASPEAKPIHLGQAARALAAGIRGLRTGELFLGLLSFEFQRLVLAAEQPTWAPDLAHAMEAFDLADIRVETASEPPSALAHALLAAQDVSTRLIPLGPGA